MSQSAVPAEAGLLSRVMHHDLGQAVGQLRACPVRLPAGGRGYFLAYGADFDVDPWHEMFYFPTDTLKLALVSDQGQQLWARDLGRGVVPGMHFCPIAAFDLDGDGVDELWFVNNVNTQHPLGVSGYRLERLDPLTGQTNGSWRWPAGNTDQSISHAYRNFVFGGQSASGPVLVTAQGTYGDMALQGWKPDLSPRWERKIAAGDQGARGSHRAVLADIDNDGAQELLWGERCIDLSTGAERFCADRDVYRGHSDVIAPFRETPGGRWLIFTCRESDPTARPRVVTYDAQGQRVWGAVDQGHMDMGWVARLGEGGRPVAMAIRIGAKTCGPDGRFHQDRDEFVYDAVTGAELKLPFSTYGTLPVDLDGDGIDELVYGMEGHDGRVIDRLGRDLGSVGGPVALVESVPGRAGQRLLAYNADGQVALWAMP